MTRSRFAASAALAVVAAGMGYLSVPVAQVQPEASAGATYASAPKGTPTQGASSPEQRAAWLERRATSGWMRSPYPRPGWSVRQGQRAALKRRNQQRNRKAHRC